MDSTELEKLLREDFYDGKTFRQLMNEPLVYGVATWVVVAYLAFMMRDEIGEEWRQLRREVSEPKWSSEYGDDWPDNRNGIGARIRSRFVHWIDERKDPAHMGELQRCNQPSIQSQQVPESREIFVGVLDQYRRKFKTRFLLHGDFPLHSLRTLQSHCPSDGLSSLDCRHRMRHSRHQNRGTNRSGLSSSETSDVSESSRSYRRPTSHLFSQL